MKLNQAISTFLSQTLLVQSAKNYQEYYRTLYRLQEFEGDVEIIDITSKQSLISNYFKHLQNNYGLNETSLFIVSLHIRNFLKYLNIDKDKIDELIDYKQRYLLYRSRFVSLVPHSIFPNEEEEMRQFWLLQRLDIISLRNALVINLLFDTGIKTMHLKKLSRKDFMPIERTILVDMNNNRQKIVITSETSELINAYLTLRKDDSDYLLVNHSFHKTDKITSRSLERILECASQTLALPEKATVTRIRYSFVAKSIANGISDKELAKLVGYSHKDQLNRFGLRKDTTNNPELNVYRYLEDFKKLGELANEWEISKNQLSRLALQNEAELRYIKHQKFLRETQVKEFIEKIKKEYDGYISASDFIEKYNCSKKSLLSFCIKNIDKCKKIRGRWYISLEVKENDIKNSLKKRGRPKSTQSQKLVPEKVSVKWPGYININIAIEKYGLSRHFLLDRCQKKLILSVKEKGSWLVNESQLSKIAKAFGIRKQ